MYVVRHFQAPPLQKLKGSGVDAPSPSPSLSNSSLSLSLQRQQRRIGLSLSLSLFYHFGPFPIFSPTPSPFPISSLATELWRRHGCVELRRWRGGSMGPRPQWSGKGGTTRGVAVHTATGRRDSSRRHSRRTGRPARPRCRPHRLAQPPRAPWRNGGGVCARRGSVRRGGAHGRGASG